MATVNLTDIKGTDGISGSRNRINSNLKILGNWINSYVDVFKIDTQNGVLDLTSTTTGKILAKRGDFNGIKISSSGSTGASINSSGAGTFVALTTQVLTTSGQVNLNGSTNIQNSINFGTGSTADFDGKINVNGQFRLGVSGSMINSSSIVNTGLTAGQKFPDTSSGGGGFATTASTPYQITAQENIIYADLASPGGFIISVGDGSTESALPEGFELTIINTNSNIGKIATGIQGSFYTGFNTNSLQGGWGAQIGVASGYAYRASIKLRWEPRIDKDSANQKGSWVILSSTNLTV